MLFYYFNAIVYVNKYKHIILFFARCLPFFSLLSFPLFSFVLLKTPPPAPPKNRIFVLVCAGGDLEGRVRGGISIKGPSRSGTFY